MRLIPLDSARQQHALKRGSGNNVQLDEQIAYSAAKADEFAPLNDAIEALWLEREHIAEALGVSVGTKKRDVMVPRGTLPFNPLRIVFILSLTHVSRVPTIKVQ